MDKIGDTLKLKRDIILKGFDPLHRGGFTQVPNIIIKDNRLSAGAKLTYALLLSYAWHKNYCYPGQVRASKEIGVSERNFRRYLIELQKVKYLEMKRRGQGKTNIYILKAKPVNK